MNKATCVRANAEASPECTEQCRGCSFMQSTLEMMPLPSAPSGAGTSEISRAAIRYIAARNQARSGASATEETSDAWNELVRLCSATEDRRG